MPIPAMSAARAARRHPHGGICCLCGKADLEPPKVQDRSCWRDVTDAGWDSGTLKGASPFLAHKACIDKHGRGCKETAAAAAASAAMAVVVAAVSPQPQPHDTSRPVPLASSLQQAADCFPTTVTRAAAATREQLASSESMCDQLRTQLSAAESLSRSASQTHCHKLEVCSQDAAALNASYEATQLHLQEAQQALSVSQTRCTEHEHTIQVIRKSGSGVLERQLV